MKPTLLIVQLFVCILIYSPIQGQVVFSDDFSDFTSSSWTSTGNLGGSEWDVFRSGVDWGARRNDTPVQLELSNDISGDGNVSGYCLVTTDASDFSPPYNTTLSNGGVVTWTFNMRQIRTNPSGFDSGNYGVAYILAGEGASVNNTGDGYAVVLGQSGSTDPVRLIRYTDGIAGNSGQTDIIVSNTTGLTDFGNDFLSIKVTYNPCLNDEWELFVRDDGTSFTDPLSGTLISQGTANDDTYTGVVLDMMATYWQGSTTAEQTAFFNNVTVSVEDLPTVTVDNNPDVCTGITTVELNYSDLTGGADEYDIDWDATAEGEGFVDIDGGALPVSPINLTIPGGATPDTYNGSLIVTNSSTGCVSPEYPFTVTIHPLPVMGCPNDTSLCSNEPSYTLMGGTPSGGTYSGSGVVGDIFDPALASPGVNTITYTYTDINDCTNTCTFDITVFTAPNAIAGSYGPGCYDGPDIELMGMPSGGTWTGNGVTGDFFDPSYGTQTLTYTYTDMNGCTDEDQTTIMVTSCADPSTMQWILLNDGDENGPCESTSDCDDNIVCYGLEYTPLYTGVLTSYTTGFFMDCDDGNNPVISNLSCVMNDNSLTQDFCSLVDSILFNSSGNSGSISVTKGVSTIIHQICFTIPSNNVMNITEDDVIGLSASIDSVGSGGFETDEVDNYPVEVIDSMAICAILPLRWLDFQARSNGDLVTLLEWTTAEEVNNSHFEIQRSRGVDDPFRTIGFVQANAVSAHINTYSFEDKQAYQGVNYYRLKQVDLDDRFGFSPIRSVTFKASSFDVAVWPNPAHSLLHVQLNNIGQQGEIELFTLSGSKINIEPIQKDISDYELALNNVTPGVYVLIVTSGDFRHVQKVVVVD